jgi:hypothetical protein
MEILIALVPLGFVASGSALLLLPVKCLLWLDLNSHFSHYMRELNASHDKNRATAKMAAFYRAFGFCFLCIGMAGLFVVLWYGPTVDLRGNP